jgi:hypothetical protein
MGIDWILDYYITAIRWIKERRSSEWAVVEGTVYASAASGVHTKIVYTYFADGERYTGEHTRGFWFAESAEAYAALFEPMRKLPVRYKAGQAEKSILRSQDLGRRATELDVV